MMPGEAGEKARVLDGACLPGHGQAWSGQRILVAGRAVEQERDPWVERNIPAVLRKIGQQQTRACIKIRGDEDEGRIGCAAHICGECCALLPAQQVPADSRRIAVRHRLAHAASEPCRHRCVKWPY